jgi:hypothetical protein
MMEKKHQNMRLPVCRDSSDGGGLFLSLAIWRSRSLLPMLGGAVGTSRSLFGDLHAFTAAIRQGVHKPVFPLDQMGGGTMGVLDFLFRGDDQSSLRPGRGVLPAKIASKRHAALRRRLAAV